MPRGKKWLNEEMWQQCAKWRKGGLTYSQICGRLAKAENMQHFGIEETPSEDTVRKEVSAFMAMELAGAAKSEERTDRSLSHKNEPHQEDLRHIIEHILSWVLDFSKPEPLLSSGPPVVMPYGGQPATVNFGIEEDPAYLALKEHLEGSELWENFLIYEELRWQYWSIISENIFDGAPEWVSSQKEHLAVLRKDRDKVWSALQDSVYQVSHGFPELLMRSKIPGSCRWCPM
jgi:hypothetical protein